MTKDKIPRQLQITQLSNGSLGTCVVINAASASKRGLIDYQTRPSLPGMGPILGAEFLVAVGDIRAFESADRLAAYAGLVPAARDSGKRVGNNKRMRGGNKTLKRVFYQSAFASLRSAPESRVFYERKRAEGKRHTQALIALARRRVNVVWAMLRDGTAFESRSAA
jgi:transposase